MKQIRLKDRIEKIKDCFSCPCMEHDDYFGDVKQCRLDGSFDYDDHTIPDDCPLEDYSPPRKCLVTFAALPSKYIPVRSCGKCPCNSAWLGGDNECCHVDCYDKGFDTTVVPTKIPDWCPLELWTEEDEKERLKRIK